jgi:hypothetical protein
MITIEIPRKSVEAEIKRLLAMQPGPNVHSYIIGALRALYWINFGYAPPSEVDMNVKTLEQLK